MAKIGLVVRYEALPEGFYKFKITDVKFDELKQRVTVELMTEQGDTHQEMFSFIKKDGLPNDGALWAFSNFAQVAMQDEHLKEVDTEALVGKFIQGTIKHQYVGEKKYAKLDEREVCTDYKQPNFNLDELL